LPKYFFHTHDHVDDEGIVLEDASEARSAALRYAGQRLAECHQSFWNTAEFHLTVTNEGGETLFGLKLSAT
jgi:hypothetical protein